MFHFLLSNLVVVKLFKLHSLLMSHLSPILVFNFTSNEIIESKNVPRIVCLRLDLTLSASLQTRLGEVQTILLVHGQIAAISIPILSQ